MTQRFVIPGRLPGYNELTRGHWRERQDTKNYGMNIAAAHARQAKIKPVKGRVNIRVSCYEKDKRRDFDNVLSGAAKVVFDALKNMGVIKGDGQRYVEYQPVPVATDRDNPRIEVELKEVAP